MTGRTPKCARGFALVAALSLAACGGSDGGSDDDDDVAMAPPDAGLMPQPGSTEGCPAPSDIGATLPPPGDEPDCPNPLFGSLPVTPDSSGIGAADAAFVGDYALTYFAWDARRFDERDGGFETVFTERHELADSTVTITLGPGGLMTADGDYTLMTVMNANGATTTVSRTITLCDGNQAGCTNARTVWRVDGGTLFLSRTRIFDDIVSDPGTFYEPEFEFELPIEGFDGDVLTLGIADTVQLMAAAGFGGDNFLRQSGVIQLRRR